MLRIFSFFGALNPISYTFLRKKVLRPDLLYFFTIKKTLDPMTPDLSY